MRRWLRGGEPRTPAERRRLFLVVRAASVLGWFTMAGCLLLLFWSHGLDPDWRLLAYVLGVLAAILGVAMWLHYAPQPQAREPGPAEPVEPPER